MSVIVGDAAVRLRPETGGFASEADDELGRDMPGVAKKAAGFFAAAFAAVKIGGFLKDAVLEASDLSESASKVGVVFGDSAAAVTAFADNAASAFGQSRSQALEAAGTFGNLLRSLGMTEKASADMSTSFVGLASDLASFNNTDPAEALDALRAGLTGETEPLKRYGINLNQAAIEQEAVRLGLSATGKDLDAATKAQASYSLIMQQSTLAQGDFARTSAGLANQQRIVAAQFVDLKANVGGALTSIVGFALQGITAGIMPALLDLTSNLPNLGVAISNMGDAFDLAFSDGLDAGFGFLDGMEGIARWPIILAANFGDLAAIFSEVFADGKAGADLLAENSLSGLAANIGQVAYQVMQVLGPAFSSIQDAIGPALDQVSSAFGDAFGGAEGGSGVFGIVIGAVQLVGGLLADYIQRWLPVIEAIIPIIADVLSGLAPVVAQIVGQIGPVLQSLMPIVQQVAGVFASTLLVVIQALTPLIPVLVQVIGQVASVLAGAFLNVLQTLAPVLPVLVGAIGQIAGLLAGAFAQALGAIAPVLPVIARVIGQVAQMLAGALASALQAIIPILPPIIDAFAQIAVVLVGALMGALQAILPVIPTLVGALLALVQAAILPLLPLLPLIANLFMSIISALAPLIPPIIQLAVVIVQLVVAAIMPLMPLLPTVIGLFTLLAQILMPVIQVVIGVVGAFVGMAATVTSVVLGFVSTVIGVFTSFWSGITSLVARIAGGVIGGFQGLKDGIVGIFSGIADFVGGMFEGVGGAIKAAINGIIRGINSTIIGGINLVIDGVNVVNPFDDVPHVPKIPTFHSGGEFLDPSGEGIALLRSRELVVTPEQRVIADNLLRDLFDGKTPQTAAGAAAGQPPITINEHIYQAEGESPGSLAARVTQGVVWNLNGGITRPAPFAETVGATR